MLTHFKCLLYVVKAKTTSPCWHCWPTFTCGVLCQPIVYFPRSKEQRRLPSPLNVDANSKSFLLLRCGLLLPPCMQLGKSFLVKSKNPAPTTKALEALCSILILAEISASVQFVKCSLVLPLLQYTGLLLYILVLLLLQYTTRPHLQFGHEPSDVWKSHLLPTQSRKECRPGRGRKTRVKHVLEASFVVEQNCTVQSGNVLSVKTLSLATHTYNT